MNSSALLRLVSKFDEFEKHWEEKPLVSRGLGDFGDVFSLDGLEKLLEDGTLRKSSVRLFRGGEEIKTDLLFRRRGGLDARAEPTLDPAKVAQAVESGATLVLEELGNYCPQVAEFATEISGGLGCHTYCVAFLTPAHGRGAPAHYDAATTFLRQVYGSKRWRIGRPVQRWPRRPWNHTEVPLDDVTEIVLGDGDCLYLPRGYVHVGDATDEASLHLTIGLRPVTWEEVFHSLLSRAADEDERLRETLPLGFHDPDEDALEHVFADKIRAVGEFLDGLGPHQADERIRQVFRPKAVERLEAKGLLRSVLAEPG
ncbi:MAG: hypothetical protein GEV03_20420 [Streptosporangiales bacterium]|nr:hypothetical protein [Streptosporangiales bacterium]